MDTSEPVEVYSTFNPAEAEIIRAMLEAEEIEADVGGETQGGFPGATPEVTIMVRATDADRARELIKARQEAAAKESEAA
jgi:Putative prokaryotic signal transducing protein